MTSRLLVVPGHRVEAQCVVTMLNTAGLAATIDLGAQDVEAVVVVVPHDLPIAPTLDAITNYRRRLPVLLLASQVDDDAAVISAMAQQYGVAAVASLECTTDVLATTARRLLEGPRQRRPDRSGGEGRLAALTAREHQVFALLAAGRRNQEIAEELGISSHTVRTHVQHLMIKLDVHHRQAAAVARSGLSTQTKYPRPASRRQATSR